MAGKITIPGEMLGSEARIGDISASALQQILKQDPEVLNDTRLVARIFRAALRGIIADTELMRELHEPDRVYDNVGCEMGYCAFTQKIERRRE